MSSPLAGEVALHRAFLWGHRARGARGSPEGASFLGYGPVTSIVEVLEKTSFWLP